MVNNVLSVERGKSACGVTMRSGRTSSDKKTGMSLIELFRRPSSLHWNVIDCDARLTPLITFVKPDAIREVSWLEEYRDLLTEDTYDAADKVGHYLLVSQPGALTLWHQDFSGTSVFYFLLKGCKIFYIVKPSENNLRLWHGFQALAPARYFLREPP